MLIMSFYCNWLCKWYSHGLFFSNFDSSFVVLVQFVWYFSIFILLLFLRYGRCCAVVKLIVSCVKLFSLFFNVYFNTVVYFVCLPQAGNW